MIIDELPIKLLIISDTHIDSIENLPSILVEEIRNADGVIHAGDVVGRKLIHQMSALNQNVYAVRGNMDPLDTNRTLPKTRMLEFHGIQIGVMHGDGSPNTLDARLFYTFPDADIIIHGHTHIPFWGKVGDKFILNPGSPLSNRRVDFNSYAILSITSEGFSAEIIKI